MLFLGAIIPLSLLKPWINSRNLNTICHSDSYLNSIVLPFYSLIAFKISIILSCFGFKVCFRPVNKIKFSSPKDPIPIENRSGIYFISCSSCNLGYIDQTRDPWDFFFLLIEGNVFKEHFTNAMKKIWILILCHLLIVILNFQ